MGDGRVVALNPCEHLKNAPPLCFQSVTKRFAGRNVLEGCSFTVGKGELCALIGANGAGKTTTVRLAVGLLQSDEGEVKVFGHVLPKQLRAVSRCIGFLPDTPFAYDWLSGREFLTFVGRLWGFSLHQAQQYADDLLARLGLGSVACSPISVYSRGMKQRLGLATALVHAPQLLVLDEPFVALDEEGQQTYCATFATHLRAGGAILFTAQDERVVQLLAQQLEYPIRVLRLVHGSIEG